MDDNCVETQLLTLILWPLETRVNACQLWGAPAVGFGVLLKKRRKYGRDAWLKRKKKNGKHRKGSVTEVRYWLWSPAILLVACCRLWTFLPLGRQQYERQRWRVGIKTRRSHPTYSPKGPSKLTEAVARMMVSFLCRHGSLANTSKEKREVQDFRIFACMPTLLAHSLGAVILSHSPNLTVWRSKVASTNVGSSMRTDEQQRGGGCNVFL